ncbi:hypothetical protein GCM10010168_18140 [Actinoplanes ianthinogenes]|uniref:Uncharacterized protein n=1 Tax=Actinoplanes ianthinogenes TaxID=122358 RepID=A0ABN6CQF7_9ACTN|nr:hypothetical protein Aiant_81130 [Actinoplanes ianthinogenes]GGR01886.1 hypothetical protein GCM10010168_18140 [Actinoplanes ianthinogenes]
MATWIGLALVPAVSLMCCVPGFAAVGGMDASCGDGFDHACMHTNTPVFSVWPLVTGGVAAAALLALLLVPRRLVSLRMFLGALVVVPPLMNALVAAVELGKAGSA